jgi:hypothetical protein
MKSNQTIEQAIETVTNSPSTIFHKDDVLRIISGIEVTKGATMTVEQIEDIASEIANRIDRRRDDICSIESVTVSAGNYGNGIDDANFNMDEDLVNEIALDVLTEHITPAEEVSTSTENNSTDNQEVTN